MKHLTAFAIFWLASALLSAQPSALWTPTNGPDGGYVYQMHQHTDNVYACTDGGLWVSADGGQSWQPYSALFAGKRVLAATFSDSEIMVLANAFLAPYDENSYFYRSTDGGQNWLTTTLSAFPSYVYLHTSSRYSRVWRDGDRLLLKNGTFYHCYSDDNGATWAKVPNPPNESITNMAINGNRLLAYSYYSRFQSNNFGVTWVSVPDTSYSRSLFGDGGFLLLLDGPSLFASFDFGQTWQGGMPAPSGMNNLDGVAKNLDGSFRYVKNHYFHSPNGLTWQDLTPSLPSTNTVEGVRVSNEFVLSGSNGIYKTSQNGTQIAKSEQGFVGSRISALEALSNGRIVASTQYSGTWSSANGGLNWEKIPAPPSTFSNQQAVFIALTAKGDTLLGLAHTDTVYQLIGHSNTWNKVTTANAWYAGESFFRVIGSDVYLVEDKQVRRSKDGGTTWEPFLPQVTSDGYRDIASIGNFLFYTTNNGKLYRSPNGGASWALVQEFWTPGAHRYNKLSAVGERLSFWSESKASYSTDFGTTWTKLNMDGYPLDASDYLEFEPQELLVHQNLIIATNPYYGVFISFDFGNSWEPFNDGLPHRRARELAVSGPNIYMGTSVDGVWRLNANLEVYGGKIYNDLNGNGQRDSGEPYLKGVLVGAEPMATYASSGADGAYQLVADSQIDTIRAMPPNKHATVKPAYRVANQPGQTYDFGVYFTPGAIDLKLDITNRRPFIPGFTNKITLTAQNIGNEPVAPCTVTFVAPAGLTINSYSPSWEATLENNTLKWNLLAMPLAEAKSIEINLTLSAWASIGEELTFDADADVANDSDPANNHVQLSAVVVGVYNPNEKSAAERIRLDEVAAGKPLEYVIRFENATWNPLVRKVVVRDMLEKSLNPATFQFISSSHPCTWRISIDGRIEFTFADIFLLPGGNVFVKFSVEADRDLVLFDSICNTAVIYLENFDPIITNTVKTTVEQSTGSVSPAQSPVLQVAPNPSTGIIWAKLPAPFLSESQLIEVFDLHGKRLATMTAKGPDNRMDLSFLPTGTYLLLATDTQSGAKAMEKVVLAR